MKCISFPIIITRISFDRNVKNEIVELVSLFKWVTSKYKRNLNAFKIVNTWLQPPIEYLIEKLVFNN